MILIILSIIMGFVGIGMGGMVKDNSFVYLFGIVGFLSPSLFVLEQLYRNMKKKSNI
jgi:hypothetical protein